MTCRILAALVLSALAGAAPQALAADKSSDKSSSRPNVISVPKGPGSIEGLGESFEANLNSGSVRETVKLVVPPGTAGLAPSLSLSYDSGFGNGPLGIGWTLGLSSIQVQTEKGLPRYDGNDRYLLDGAELVALGDRVYRQKIEGRFARVRRGGEHWEVDLPDGKTLRYGVTAEGRVESSNAVYAWYLEEVVDRWGNRIGYFYGKDSGQVYLTEIQYNRRSGAAESRIVFEYEARPDVVSDCRARFCVATARRLRQVSMFSRGALVRRYRLDYEQRNGLSLLSAVTQVGSDDVTTLPPARFWYSEFAASGTPFAMQSAPSYLPAPGSGNDELVDLDGDGFVDLVHVETGTSWYYLNQGGLRFGSQQGLYLAGSCASGSCASPSVALSSSGVEVGDLNGDGLADLIVKAGAGGFWYHPNHGDGTWQPSESFTGNPTFGFEDPNVRMLDFDHDKLVDVLRWTSSGFHLWRNQGDGSWEGPVTVDLPAGFSSYAASGFEDSHLKLADLNGDRLLDLVYLRSGSVTFWPSLGWGYFGEPVTVQNAPDPGRPAEADLMLADVNGDGLTDLIWVDTDHVDIWPLQPWGAFGEQIRILNTPHRHPALTAVRLADLNGNGSTDIVWSTPTEVAEKRLVYLDVVGELRPNLLTAVENGLGKRVELKYGSSGAEYQEAREAGRPWATRVPFPVAVLAESAVEDGLGHRQVTGYRYRDGWYAPDTREFRGFAEATVTELGDEQEATAVTVHGFDLGKGHEARKGLPLSVEVRTEAGAVLQRESSGYTVHVYATGLGGEEVAGPQKLWHQVDHVEGTASPISTREELTWDEYGNVLVHSQWGVVSGSDKLAGHDERITTTEYANDTDQWLLGRPIHRLVTDAAQSRLAESRTYYDGEPFVGLPFGQLGAQGAPTRTESWVSGDHFAQTERVQRDDYGLTIATLDPVGTRREVEYDSETHCFPVSERWYYGERVLTFSASYNLAQGLLTSYRDPGGVESWFQWDALQHLVGIVKSGDSAQLPTLAFEYLYGNPVSRVVQRARVESGQSETLETDHLYDGLGRKLGAIQQAEDGKTVVSGMRDLGLQGRVIREYEPFFSQGYELPAAATTKYTSHFYDGLGRNLRSLLPDGSTSERRYAPLAVEHWDAEDLDPASTHAGTPRTERLNALGAAEVEERLGAEKHLTQFQRDALGRVTQVTDAVGQVSFWHFDGLGRADEIVHTDAGQIRFGFDDAGNLLSRRDARGALMTTDYDPLGRPLLTRLVDAGGAEEERIEYHYDDPSPLFPQDVAFGELAWVKDAVGEEHYRRDERGRLIEFARQVDGKEYRVRHGYDALDRPRSVTYPDGKQIELRYNPRGLLQSVPGVISALTYDARGLALQREHSNGAVTTASYDDLDRLSSLATQTRGQTVQSLFYGYDRVGNVMRIDDALRPSGSLSQTRIFSHDDLYRLLTAQGAERAWSQAFDPAGSFKEKSGAGQYTYGRAHQATSIGGKDYRYDEAGNVIERPGSKQVFDAQGRVKSITLSGGTVVSYRYDYTGARVVKEVAGPKGSHCTVYLDQLAEERDGEMVDYVFAGNARVARLGGARPVPVVAGILSALPPVTAAAALTLLFAAALSGLLRSLRRRARPLIAAGTACAFLSLTVSGCGYSQVSGAIPAIHYHQDHLGGVALQTGENGEFVAELSNGPWGERLQGSTEPYGFTGKEWEEEAGLYDFGARLYDPAIGRFLSPDPASIENPEVGIGDPQFLNPYAYARNSPSSHADSDGQLPHIVVGAIGGGLIGAAVYLVKASVTGEFSGRGLAAATAGGAVTGALAAATCGASLVAQGAAAGLVGGIVQRAVETGSFSKTYDPMAMAMDTVLGGAAGPAIKAAGKGLSALAEKAAPIVKQAVVKAASTASKVGGVVARQTRGVIAQANVTFRSFATEMNKAVFYSGKDQWRVAGRYAAWMGKQTISDTAGGSWLSSFEQRFGAVPQYVWDAASKKFARGATGEVAVLAEGAVKSGAFYRVELPELLSSPNISRINVAGTPKNFTLDPR